jgi:hypothetical protein
MWHPSRRREERPGRPGDLIPVQPGSFLVVSQITEDVARPGQMERGTGVYEQGGVALRARSRDEFAALLPAGLQLVEPGITVAHRWRSGSDAGRYTDEEVSIYAAVARQP